MRTSRARRRPRLHAAAAERAGRRPGSVADRLSVVANPAVDEPPAELTRSERLLGEQLANRVPELFWVDAAHPPPERAVVRALDGGLHERPEENGVANRDEMHGSSHQR